MKFKLEIDVNDDSGNREYLAVALVRVAAEITNKSSRLREGDSRIVTNCGGVAIGEWEVTK